MAYDLLIKNGMVIDGSGLPRYRGDVGVTAGKIVAIGRHPRGRPRGHRRRGQVVAPGFVDGHTHMDAQVFWDPLGTSSCWHGITSVVMGNCGFTLAPCAKKDSHLVVRNLERAEDIAGEAMEAGIDWRWTTFPEFLDTLESLPKGINYSGYIGHSALRTYVMGERAFERARERGRPAPRWSASCADALMAGAIGFTTSRSPSHETPDPTPGGEPHGRLERGAAARGRDGRAERGHLRARRRGRGPQGRPPGPARLPQAAAAPSRSRPAGRSPSASSAGARTRRTCGATT